MGKGRRNRERRLRREHVGDTQLFGAHVGTGPWAGISASAIPLLIEGKTIEEVNTLAARAAKAIEAAVAAIPGVRITTEIEAQRYILRETLQALDDHKEAGSFGGGPWTA